MSNRFKIIGGGFTVPGNLNPSTINVTNELRIPIYDTLPTIQEEGSILYNSGDDILYASDGVNWNEVGATPLPTPLQSIANLTTTENDMIYTTASDVYNTTSLTAQGRALLDDTTAVQQRATIGVVIGSDVQPYDTTLSNIAAVTTVQDQMLYTTASDTFGATNLTPFSRTLLDDTSASTARTTLGAIGSGGNSTDNAIVKWDLTGGTTVQNSGVIISDLNNISGINDVAVGNNLTVTGNIDGITPSERAQLTTIGTTTISATQWGYLGSMDQSTTTGDNVTFNNLTITGTLAGLTLAEIAQLSNIGTTTISGTQWGYLGSLDQGISTTDSPTFSGLNAGNQKITAVATPTVGTDAANKNYVDDALVAGITPIEAAVFSSTQDLSSEGYGVVTYNGAGVGVLTPANNGALSLDGVAATLNARTLIKDQATQTQNGVYQVTIVGDGGSTWELTRVTNFQKGDTVAANTFIFVENGTSIGNTSWVLEDTNPGGSIVVDTNNIIWAQLSAGQNLSAGNGIDITGSVVSVDATSDFTFSGGQLDINAPVIVPNGGTGKTTLTSGNVLVGAGAAAVTTTKAAPSGDFVGTTDIQTLTNKTLSTPTLTNPAITGGTLTNTSLSTNTITTPTISGGTMDNTTLTNATITAASNTVRATQLATAGADVVISGGVAPTGAGEVLTSTGVATAGWAAPVAGGLARVLTVSASGGDYTTVAAAITGAIALVPTAANPVIIEVGPGTYTEVNPLTVPDYVAINGTGGSYDSIIAPTNTAGTIFILSKQTTLRNLDISGATTGIGVDIPHGESGSVVNFCQITNCQTGIRLTGSAADNTSLSVSTVWIKVTSIAMSYGILCQTGAHVGCSILRLVCSGGTMTTGIRITGNDGATKSSTSTISNLVISRSGVGTGLVVDNGLSTSVPAECNVSSSYIYGPDTGFEIGLNGYCQLLATNVDSSVTYDLNLSDSTAKCIGAGNRMRSDKIAVTTGSTLVMEMVSDKISDEGLDIRGELHVGYYADPRETVLGGGDSHTINMYVFVEDTLGAFTDYTTEASEDDGNTFPLFASTAATNRCYFGLADTTITGGFPGIKVVDIQTALVLGSGSLVWEYWDGGSWTETQIMAAQSSANYLPRATTGAFAYTENQQIRFGDTTGWGTTTVNGVLGYWIRVGIQSTITTIAVIDQIKLHTNRTEINGEGWMEFFGSARPLVRYPFDINLTLNAGVTGSTSATNQDIYISDTLGVGRERNNFRKVGSDPFIGTNFDLPENVDTSFPITLEIRWFTDTLGGGNIKWQVRWGFTTDEADDATSVSDVFTSLTSAPVTGPNEQSTTTVVAVGNRRKQHTTTIDMAIPDMVAWRSGTSVGDHFWFVLGRNSTDAQDTHSGDIIVLNITPYYRSWCIGKFVS